MRYFTGNSLFVWLSFACLILLADASAQTRRARREPSVPIVGASAVQKDTVAKQPVSSFDEVARRVDSLQFIVVYNAELLRKDIDKKVIWIYIMLGVTILASMVIYGAFSAAQRQRKELEERVYSQLSASVSQLESEIKTIQEAKKPAKSPSKPPARRSKRSR